MTRTHSTGVIGTSVVRAISGLNERDLHYLCAQPDMATTGPTGTGNWKEWTQAGATVVLAYAALRNTIENRQAFSACRAIGAFVEANGVEALQGRWAVIRPDAVFITNHPGEAIGYGHGTCTVIALEPISSQVLSVFNESEK